jgi:2-dehydropantoate 2-reductase
MKICFFGVGGVGGYFGTIITDKFKDKHDIYFVARGGHKNAICTNGLTLKKSGGEQIINVSPTLCTDNIDDLPICDIVFLSVKGYDLANAAKSLNKISNEKTIILPLLNGVDIYERIREHFVTGIVLSSCVYIGTHIESPGVIFQKGGNCNIFIGKDPMLPDFYPDSLLTLLTDSNLDFKWENNIEVPIWSKYMFIAAYGLVTATYEKTLGEILDNSELSQITKAIMGEIELIAKRTNVPLSSDIVETSFLKGKQFPHETKTSFQRDVESKGKINEIDLFGGTLIRYSEQYNIMIPNIMNVFDRFMEKMK